MPNKEIFDSALRSAGDLAGVFEYDGETGYFYLYQTEGHSNKVLEAIHVFSGHFDFRKAEIEVRWNSSEESVGLFIHGELWAVFEADKLIKHGGDYKPDGHAHLPNGATVGFDLSS